MEPPTSSQTLHATLRAMGRGLVLRCPRCTPGRMPRSLFGIGGRCPVCDLPFELGAGDFSGAIMIAQLLLGLLAIPLWLALTLWTTWSFTMTVLVTVVLLTILLVLGYRNIKGMWFGFLYAADRLQHGALPQTPDRRA